MFYGGDKECTRTRAHTLGARCVLVGDLWGERARIIRAGVRVFVSCSHVGALACW